MPAVDLMTAGEAFEDLVFVDLPRLPRAGEEVRTSRFFQTVGGGAVITAVAAARLGLRCGIISGLSPAAGAMLRRERVRVTDVRRRGEPHAITAALSSAGNRSFVTFNGINDHLEGRLLLRIRKIPARHVHLAFCPARCARWHAVVAALRGRGATTSWDFGWNERLLHDKGFLPLAAAVDYVFMNEQEAALYARTRRMRDARAFWKSHARVAVVKLGRRGSQWISADLTVQEPAPTVRPIDTTGAGDAFNGGFLHARLRGRSPAQSLRAGNRIGALSTRAPGGLAGLPARKRS